VSAGESGKVVRFAHQLPLTLEDIPGTHFSKRLSRSQGYSVAGSIKSLKNLDEHIWNLTCDLAGCNTVPQLASSLRTSTCACVLPKMFLSFEPQNVHLTLFYYFFRLYSQERHSPPSCLQLNKPHHPK
jgi:hypothetical protein